MTRTRKNTAPAAAACLAVAAMLVTAACSSSGGSGGLPTNLPRIALNGSTSTPPHNMPSYEYPFDSNGRYVSEWAAEGERRAGRSASATSADSSRWSSSHGGSSATRRTTSSKSRSTSSSSKSKGGRSYTVKGGDTLSHIAARYGTSVAKIKAANGMKSDFLSIGRVLRIP